MRCPCPAPLLHRALLLAVVHALGKGAGDGAREAERVRGPGAEGGGEHAPLLHLPCARQRGIVVFRSWSQTLASWMPSVDERCIME